MEIWRIMIDFGLVVLVWMTQLVVYSGFTYFAEQDMHRWHSKYTTRITMIVAPLMFAQVGLIGYQIIEYYHTLTLISAILVGLVWAHTFFLAVPLHNKIEEGASIKQNCEKLVKINWTRTALWSTIWILGLVEYLLK